MDEEEIKNLKISVDTLWEEFHCPICFNLIKDCGMLPCGHNMCFECLDECVQREHVCPCCRAPSTRDAIIKNHHFDKICDLIKTQKEEAEKKYFEDLIRGAHRMDIDQVTGTEVNADEQSPVEKAFQTQLKKGLIAYQDYYDMHLKDLKSGKHKYHEQCKTEISMARKAFERDHPFDDPDRLQATQLLEGKCITIEKTYEQKIQLIEEKFRDSMALLLTSYEAYMKKAVPDPKLLPVVVNVILLKKGYEFNVELEPGMKVDGLRALIEGRVVEEKNDLIKAWSQQNAVVFLKPFAGVYEGDMTKIDPFRAGGVLLSEHKSLIADYQIPNNSYLYVIGSIPLKSDEPPVCFSAQFRKGSNQTVDYYQCNDCKINWVCKACAQSCHDGHNVTVFALGHVPAWACCYCVKNKKCRIQNIKNSDIGSSSDS